MPRSNTCCVCVCVCICLCQTHILSCDQANYIHVLDLLYYSSCVVPLSVVIWFRCVWKEFLKPQERGKFYTFHHDVLWSACVLGGCFCFSFSRPDLTNRNHSVEVLILILSLSERAVYSHARLLGRMYSNNFGPKNLNIFNLYYQVLCNSKTRVRRSSPSLMS